MSIMTDSLAHRSKAAALEVLRKLCPLVRLDGQQRHDLLGSQWAKASIAFGDMGIALPLLLSNDASLSACGEDLVKQITSSLSISKAGLGLLDGLTGYALALSLTNIDIEHHYIRKINNEIYRRTKELLAALSKDASLKPIDYDMVYGLSGIARYLLYLSSSDAAAEKFLRKIIRAFIDWSLMPAPKGFFIAKSNVPEPICNQSPILCDGYYDMGLAHGIPGPMVILSLSWQSGITEPGQQEAVKAIMDRLYMAASPTPWGLNIGYRLSPKHSHSHLGISRAGWCYGNVGVASAVLIAAQSFGQTEWGKFAIDLIDGAFQRPMPLLGLASPMICHGYSGALLVLNRFLINGPPQLSQRFQQQYKMYINKLLSLYSADTVYGFLNPQGESLLKNDPSFLTGAAGSALTLLTLSGAVEPRWDMLLLLS